MERITMPHKCKFDYTYKCTYASCDDKCPIFRKTGQMTFAKPPPKVIKTMTHKGVKTTYYEVKKHGNK